MSKNLKPSLPPKDDEKFGDPTPNLHVKLVRGNQAKHVVESINVHKLRPRKEPSNVSEQQSSLVNILVYCKKNSRELRSETPNQIHSLPQTKVDRKLPKENVSRAEPNRATKVDRTKQRRRNQSGNIGTTSDILDALVKRTASLFEKAQNAGGDHKTRAPHRELRGGHLQRELRRSSVKTPEKVAAANHRYQCDVNQIAPTNVVNLAVTPGPIIGKGHRKSSSCMSLWPKSAQSHGSFKSAAHVSRKTKEVCEEHVLPNSHEQEIQDNFTEIRNNWVKIAKTLEGLRWTLGSQQAHEKRIEKLFIRCQAEKQFCDVVINTAHNHTIHAHSLVLASHSKVFEKRLLAMNPGVGIQTLYKLTLTDKATAAAVAKAVDWMYRGSTRISSENLSGLIGAARFFNMMPLAVECLRRKIVLDTIEERRQGRNSREHAIQNSASSASSLASSEHPSSLKSPQTFIPPSATEIDLDSATNEGDQQNQHDPEQLEEPFDNLVFSKRKECEELSVSTMQNDQEEANLVYYIVSLSATQLHDLLADDNLSVQSELEVLDAVMTWIAAAPVQREIYTHQLLGCVRFYHLTNEELTSCFKQHPSYFKLPLFRNVLGNAFRAKALLEAGQPFPADVVFQPNRCQNKFVSP